MPLLQVKDCPDELYNTVRDLAHRNHRSIAGETLVALEEHTSPRKTSSQQDQITAKRSKALETLASPSSKSLQDIDFASLVHEVRGE